MYSIKKKYCKNFVNKIKLIQQYINKIILLKFKNNEKILKILLQKLKKILKFIAKI